MPGISPARRRFDWWIGGHSTAFRVLPPHPWRANRLRPQLAPEDRSGPPFPRFACQSPVACVSASSHHADVSLAGARKLGNHFTPVSCPPAPRSVAEHHAPRHAQANRCPCRESARHGVASIRWSADTSLRFVSLGTTIGSRASRTGATRRPERRAARARLPGPLLSETMVFWKSRLRRALITSTTPRTIRTPQLAHAAPHTVACAGNQPGTVALTIGCAVRARITRQQSRQPAP